MPQQLTCRELIQFLDAYVEDRLPAARRSLFESHLAICPQCVEYVESYESSIRLVKGALSPPRDHDGKEEEPLPADVPEELVQAILATRKLGD